ncbi:MAG: Cna B-type domain-containing protein, partial [Christensenellaceae bacterium]|nr:Cna B-type domain-containing protein [Christensenellaceae bacterium]
MFIKRKRIMAMFLAVMMIIQLLPLQVLAETLYSPPITLENQVNSKGLNEDPPPSFYDVNIHYQYEDGTMASPSFLGKYVDGTSYSIPSPTVTGHAPLPSDQVITGTVNGSDVTRTVTYYFSDKNYLVRHWKQTVTGGADFNPTNFVLVATDTQSGSVGSLTRALPKDYPEFTLQPYSDLVIPADGQAVVDLYYTRNSYSIFFNSNGGFAVSPITERFEAPINTTPVPARPGYVFQGWDWNNDGVYNSSDVPPATMPGNNITVKAIWNPGTANYKIVYWSQNAVDDGYSYLGFFDKGPVPTESTAPAEALSATTSSPYYWGNLQNRAANFQTEFWNVRAYFQDPIIETQTVSGDGSTVVNVRYNRKLYNLRFITDRYRWTGSSWTYSPDGTYTYKEVPNVRLGQKIDSLWLDYPQLTDGTNVSTGYKYQEGSTTYLAGRYRTSYNFDSFANFNIWRDTNGTGYATRQFMLTTSMIDSAAGNTATIQAQWTTSTLYTRHAIYLIRESNGTYTTHSTFTTSQLSGSSLVAKEFDGLTHSSGDPMNYSSTTTTKEYPVGSGNYYNYIFVYTRNEYQLGFNTNGGEFPDGTTSFGPQSVPYGTQIQPGNIPPAPPVRTGYTFTGWYIDTYGETQFYLYDFDGNLVSMPPNNVQLYAGWVPQTYNINWYIDKETLDAGGAYLGSQTVEYSKPSAIPEEPVKADCTFLGWYVTDENGLEQRYVFGSPVTRDANVYAKWAASGTVIYTVRHLRVSDSSEIVSPQTYVVLKGQTTTFDAQTLYGYLPDALSKPSTVADVNNVVTFWYKPSQEGVYRVYLKERETIDELGPPPHYYEDSPPTSYRIVTEYNSRIINGYNRVNLYEQITMLTTNPEDNTITFYYDPVLKYKSQNNAFGTVSNTQEAVLAKTGTPAGSVANANAGYVFNNWIDESGNVVSTDPNFVPTTATTGDPSQFVPQTYTATFLANVTATKVWAGNGPEPFPEVCFQLFRKTDAMAAAEPVPGAQIKLIPYIAGQTVKTVSWGNLAPEDAQGNAYTFSVKETRVDGTDYTPVNYQKEEVGTTVTNTWQTRNFKVQKVWDGGTPPTEGAEVVLLQNDAVYKTATLTATNTEHTWTGLPMYDATGVAYTYRVEEPNVPDGYQRTISGPTANYDAIITNKYYGVPLKAVKFVSNPEIIPADLGVVSFTLELNQDGIEYDSFELSSPVTVPLSPMVKEYTDLPQYKQDIDIATGNVTLHEHQYTITEKNIPTNFLRESVIYNQAEGQWEVTNQFNRGSFYAEKIWDILPDPGTTVTFGLYRTINHSYQSPPPGNPEFEYMGTAYDIQLDGVTEDQAWVAVWQNLDGDDPQGNIYIFYAVEKDGPADYDIVSSASTKVVNQAQTIDFFAAKKWVDGANDRPANITLTLSRSANGVADSWSSELTLDGTADALPGATGETAPSADGNTWNAQWMDLPRFNNEKVEYQYSVSEPAITNYISSGPVLENGVHTITNTYNQPLGNIIGTKKWVDGESLRGQVVIRLFDGTTWTNGILDGSQNVDETSGTGSGELAPSADGNTWRYIWKDKPLKDINGNTITYTVEEYTDLSPTFTSTENGLTVTNTYNMTYADVTGTKTWVDGQAVRHDNLTMQLWRKVVVGGTTVTDEYVSGTDFAIPTESSEQTATVSKTWLAQPVTDSQGRTYTYYIKEGVGTGAAFAEGLPAGSNFTVSGEGTLALTNTYQQPLTAEDVVGKKTWVNGQVARHNNLTMQLWRKVVVAGATVTDEFVEGSSEPTIGIGSETDAQFTFQNNWGKLPATDTLGRDYTYYIKEGVGTGTAFAEGLPAGSNFTASGVGTLELTNTYTIPRANQTGTKVWIGPDGVTPLPTDSKYRTDLYLRIYRSFVNIDGITIKQMGHGAGADDILVTGASDGTATWNNLPLTRIDGRPYTFWVVEVASAGASDETWMPLNFIKTEEGMTVTNTMIPPTSNIKVTKAYLNGAGDAPAAGDVDNPAATDKLKFKFSAVDPYGMLHEFYLAPGESMDFNNVVQGWYQITEIETHGYTPSYSPAQEYFLTKDETLLVTITNTNTDQTTTGFTVHKNWVNGPLSDHDVVINLYRGIAGQQTLQKVTDAPVVTPVTPVNPGESKFTYTWDNLPLYNSYGIPYIYSAKEEGLIENNGSYELHKGDNVYVSTSSGSLTDPANPLTFTNTYVPNTDGTATAIKQWVNGSSAEHVPVTMKLWRSLDNGATMEEVTGTTPVIDPAAGPSNTFTYTWSNLQRKDNNGVEYTFYFTEEDATIPVEYALTYSASVSDGTKDYAPSGATAYNTYTSPTIEVTAKKIWENGDILDHTPVVLSLYRKIDGGTLQLVSKDYTVGPATLIGGKIEYDYTWTGVDKTDINGNVYTYYFKEDVVSGYTRIYASPYENDYGLAGTAVTNKYIQPTITVSGTKVWVYGNNSNRPDVYMKLYRSTDANAVEADWEAVPNAALYHLDNTAVYTENPERVFTTTFNWNDIHERDEKAKLYYFFVKEVNANGVDFTPSRYEKTETNTLVRNVYQATGIFTPQVTKKLAGRTLKDGEFNFELYNGTGTIETKSNDASGNVSFTDIEYTSADIGKTYTYFVREVVPAVVETGMTYDDQTVVEVNVTITDNFLNDGNLIVTPVYSIDTEFNNSYVASGELASGAWATKSLTGRTLRANEFSFELKDSGGIVLQQKSNDVNGNITFDAIQYTQADIGNTYTYTINEIIPAVGESGMAYDSRTITFTVKVEDGGNGALIVTPSFPANVEFKNVFTPNPVMTASKESNKNTYATVGETITYTVTLNNEGNVPLENVSVTDTLVDLSTVTPTESMNQDGILEIGETWTYEYTHEVTQDDIDASLITNTFKATHVDIPAGVTAQKTVNAVQGPAMEVSKEANKTTYLTAGELITYTVKLNNTGNVTLENVSVTDSLVTLTNAMRTESKNPDGKLEVGETWTYEYTYAVKQADIDSGSITNVFEATHADITDEVKAQNTINATQTPAMEANKEANKTTYATVGDVLTYTVKLKNTGNLTLEGVTVEDTLVDLSTITPTESMTSDGKLEVGETWTYEYTYEVTQADIDAGSITNEFTANHIRIPGGATAEKTVDATQTPAMEATKEANNPTYSTVGETI